MAELNTCCTSAEQTATGDVRERVREGFVDGVAARAGVEGADVQRQGFGKADHAPLRGGIGGAQREAERWGVQAQQALTESGLSDTRMLQALADWVWQRRH